MAFKFYETRPNTIKQLQTRPWPNGEMFGHQTMFDGVWSPNISRLDRPQRSDAVQYDEIQIIRPSFVLAKKSFRLKKLEVNIYMIPAEIGFF